MSWTSIREPHNNRTAASRSSEDHSRWLGESLVHDVSLRENFGILLDGSGQMFWELDRDFRVVYANRLLIETYGDPVGQICHKFMAGSDRVCDQCPVRKVFDGAGRAVSERSRTDKHGNAIWIQHTATPVVDAEGALVGASELMINITDRRQMEEWLRDSEALYRNLVEEVPDVIFCLDADGRFSFANTQVESFLGYSVDQILETPLRDHVVPDDRELLETIFDVRPDDIWDEEVGIHDRNGELKFVRIRCKASFDESNRRIGFEGVMRDRTERRKLEQDLRASKEALVQKIMIIDELYEHIVQSGKCKAIQDHTAEVAHELRQPLVIVGGFARRIARELDSGKPHVIERRKRYVDLIITEIERLERILEKLIDFTRRGEVQLQRIDPNALIEYILGVTDGRLKEKGLHVRKNLGSELGEIPVDPGRFQQLILNLVSNAIDASPTGGAIELETGATIPIDKALRTGELQSDVFFELKIRNNGPTIPPEVLEQIFNPFFTTKRHGTGLGLTVSRKIVEDHAGSISVKSDENGTIFTIWLPMN